MALALAGCGQQAGSWRLLTPAGTHIFSVATDPHIPELVYAGADSGGVYRARADQTGLAAPSDGIPDQTVVASILPDPKIAGRLLAGTTGGLYRSDHYGDQWARFGKGLPSGGAALALASVPDDTLLLAGIDNNGLYRSLDDGATWTPSSSGLPAKATVAALSWDAASQRWLAGLQDDTGHEIYASQDGGQTWAASDAGIPSGTIVYGLVTLTSASGGAARMAATSKGLFEESAGGQNWTKINAGLPAGPSYAIAAINGQPDGVVAAIGANVYYSDSAGASWSLVAHGLTNDVPALAVASNGHGVRVFYAASGQLARFPTGVSTSDSTSFLLIALISAILVAGGYALMRRNRRYGYAMGASDNEGTAGPGAAADRARRRQQSGASPSGPYFPSLGENSQPAEKRPKPAKGGAAPILAPTDLTTRDQSGPPAAPEKAAQNGHGVSKKNE
jgi:hypothetical protein